MISLIGMGSGCPESLTAQGLAALQSAGLILGAKRLLEHLPAGCTDNCKAVYKPEEILACLAAQSDTDTAVLYSGDTGFYSGAAKLLPLLRVMGYSVRGLPGTVCPAAERELRPACCYPGGCSERVAHRCRVRRLSVLRAGAGGYGRQNLPHGGCAAGQRAQHRAAGALWLCRHDGKGRQYAFPRRRNAARP